MNYHIKNVSIVNIKSGAKNIDLCAKELNNEETEI